MSPPIVKRVAQASMFRMLVNSMEDDPNKTLELFPWLPDVVGLDTDDTRDIGWRTIQKLKELV